MHELHNAYQLPLGTGDDPSRCQQIEKRGWVEFYPEKRVGCESHNFSFSSSAVLHRTLQKI